MKYMLDIVLVIGLLVIGNMWNREKQNGLELSDEIDKLKANVAQLELDLGKATDELGTASSGLEATKAALAQSETDLRAKSDALAAKTAEADEVRAAAVRAEEARGRTGGLQGQGDRGGNAQAGSKIPLKGFSGGKNKNRIQKRM